MREARAKFLFKEVAMNSHLFVFLGGVVVGMIVMFGACWLKVRSMGDSLKLRDSRIHVLEGFIKKHGLGI